MTIFDATSLAQKTEPEGDPSFGNIFSVTSLNGPLDAAQAKVHVNADANPDQAAQSIPIAKDLGVEPREVDNDFEAFSRKHGLAVASNLVGENPALVNYLNKNQMASRVSNDDYSQLHDVSTELGKSGQKSFMENWADILNGIWKGVREGPETDPSLIQGYKDSLLKQGVDPAIADSQSQMFAMRAFRNEYLLNALFAIPSAIISPGTAYFRSNVAPVLERATGLPPETQEAYLMAGLGWLGLKSAPRLQEAFRRTEPFMNEGKPVPVGADPATDKIHIEQAKDDKKMMADLKSAVDKSQTRERSPELFEQFLKEHPETNREIGIPADVLRQLYGDELKGLEWIPNIQEQMATAAYTGGDIKMPVSTFLTFIEKERMKEIEDHIRVREGGVTPDEAKQGIEVYHGSPHEFEAFDIGKAGTGEGAQSYGFGHYFAENQEVANSYRPDLEKVASAIKGEIPSSQIPAGSLYKARILRKPEEFLDYDKKFEEQSLHVQEKLRALGLTDLEGLEGREIYTKAGIPEGTDPDVAKVLQSPIAKDAMDQKRSKALSDAGIAGIKYLDQFSRDLPELPERIKQIEGDLLKGGWADDTIKSMQDRLAEYKSQVGNAPTSNFVVFRDADIQVLERNGEVVNTLRQASGLNPMTPYAKPKVAPDITKAFYEKYAKLIAEQRAADQEYYMKKALQNSKRTLSREWKEQEQAVRLEVILESKRQPDFSADALFREGKLGNQEIGKPKIGEEYLDLVERAAIPESFVSKTGISPDEAAAMTGHATGKELLQDLAKWEADRKASGMRPMDFRRRMIDAQVEKQMQIRHGVLNDKIVEDAKEHVLKQVAEDRLKEEATIEALEAGMKYEDARAILEQSRQRAIDAFEQGPVRNAKSDAYLANIGRIDRQVEGGLLKDDIGGAFTARERKFVAAVLARRSLEIEKSAEDLAKTVKKYSGRDLPNVERPAVNFIRQLLTDAGVKLRVLPEEIARAIQEEGGTFPDYVAERASAGWTPDVSADILRDGAKHVEDMSVAEFRQFANAIDSLDYIGRQENKFDLLGQKMDRIAFEDKVIENLKQRPIRDADEAAKGGKWLYGLDAPLTRMEEIVKDIDMRKELGPLYNALIAPFTRAKNDSYNTLAALQKQIAAIKDKGFGREWLATLDKEVSHDFVHDKWNNEPFALTKWNVIKMALNMGNKSNMKTLIDGIARAGMETKEKPTPEHLALIEAKVRELIDKNLTPQDMKFVQHLWDLAGQYKDRIYQLNYATGAREAKFIEPLDLQTVHGTFKGGYFPLIPDTLRSFEIGAPRREINGALGKDYFRANTNQNHLEARTGASYFVDITGGPEQLIGRLQQVVHDLAFREFAIEAGKVIYNKRIRNAIEKYYGVEYAQQMEPWYERIVNQANVPEKALGKWNDMLRQFRLNLIAYALPLNYAVTFSTSLGTANLRTFAQFNANRTMNKAMVMKHSQELQHTMYSLDRDVQEALSRVFNTGKYTTFQIRAMETMFKPMVWLEQQARMNTFFGEFMRAKNDGRSDFEAGMIGDSAIRERHGASHAGDLPAIAAHPNEYVKMATVFMGYFNTQRNWLRQVPHEMREGNFASAAKIMWGVVAINALVNAALFERRRKDDTFFSFMGRSLMSTPFSMIPHVRDAYNYYTQGYRPTPSVLSAIMAAGDLLKDGANVARRKPLKHGVKDTASFVGQVFGVPGTLQAGRTGQFLSDVSRGTQHPKGFTEWMRGVFTGESQLRK